MSRSSEYRRALIKFGTEVHPGLLSFYVILILVLSVRWYMINPISGFIPLYLCAIFSWWLNKGFDELKEEEGS